MANLNQYYSQCSKQVHIQLYKHTQGTHIPAKFRAKLASKKNQYPELERFKLQQEKEHNDAHPDLYAEAKHKLLRYRLVFFSLALVFVFFAVLIQGLSFNWSYAVLFASTIKVKTLMASACWVFSTTSFMCGYMLAPLEEATRFVAGKAAKSLWLAHKKHYLHRRLHFACLWGEKRRRRLALSHLYHEASHKIHERREESYRLLANISQSPTLSDKAKERLYNQALAELYEKLGAIVSAFKQIDLDSPLHPSRS